MDNVLFFDSTLRDGAQSEGISFSVQDKLNIVKALDNLGIDFIEAGNPFSNPKDMEFFQLVKNLKLENSKIVAFGSTRRKNTKVEVDKNLITLLKTDCENLAVFGKSWDLHVSRILNTTLKENLNMIFDTIKFLKSKNKTVFYDAEHFFDGYLNNAEYALETLKTAENAGADNICLCDTNGGCGFKQIENIVKEVKKVINVNISIHAHNDCGLGVANSIIAVESGCNCVQGTLLGYGERCGNANLSTIIPTLQLKMNYKTNIAENILKLTTVSRIVAEISNISLSKNLPYVGKSAFCHKAGMHIDGVKKEPKSFEHIVPTSVGNVRRFLLSEMAGRSTILNKIKKFKPDIKKDSKETLQIIKKVKELELEGYQFEGADASFEMLILKELNKFYPYFKIIYFKCTAEQTFNNEYMPANAVVKIEVNNQTEITISEGDGPVNALDKALRKALEKFYPSIKDMKLTDYKVRILDSVKTTSAITRVLIESTDGMDIWNTVGVSKDIIEASMIACVDAIEYKLNKDNGE